MYDFKKLSKTLVLATALTGVMAISTVSSNVSDVLGGQAYAQELGVASPQRAAAAQKAVDARPARKSPGFSERAYNVLSKVQELLDADPPQYGEAMSTLQGQNLERLNSNERASFYQMMAAVAQNQEKYDEAMGYYQKILQEDNISYALEDQVTFILGQLYFANGDYTKALEFMNKWFAYQPDPTVTNIVVFANIYYAAGLEEGIPEATAEKYYRAAVEFLNWAIAKTEAAGEETKENWYAVLRALHNNLGEMDKVLEYAELLASRWPSKQYWVQLSGLYAQFASQAGLSEDKVREFERKQMTTYELVHRQNLLDTGRELETMSQMFLYHEIPYKASKTLSKSIEQGLSEKNEKNENLLGMAYITGKDFEKAVEPLKIAAELADDGNTYLQLANVYLNLDQYEDAAEAIGKALQKGDVRRADQASLLQGQAYLSLEMFDKARASFREAAKDERSAKTAQNMLKYVDNEEKRIKDIREYLS